MAPWVEVTMDDITKEGTQTRRCLEICELGRDIELELELEEYSVHDEETKVGF